MLEKNDGRAFGRGAVDLFVFDESASGSPGDAPDLERQTLCQRRWWPQRDTHPFVLWNFAELYAPPSPSRALHLSQLLPSPVIGRRFRSRAPPQSPKSNDLPFEIDQMGMTREKGNWTRFFHDL